MYLAQQNVPLTIQPVGATVPSGPVRGLSIAGHEGNPVELLERVTR